MYYMLVMKQIDINPLSVGYAEYKRDFEQKHPVLSMLMHDYGCDWYPGILNRMLRRRPKVWQRGYWLDSETERFARLIAEICEDTGLVSRAAFVPADKVRVINDLGLEVGLMPVIRSSIECSFSCSLGPEEVDANTDMTFGEFVERIRNRTGTVREFESEKVRVKPWCFNKAFRRRCLTNWGRRFDVERAIEKSINAHLAGRGDTWGVGFWSNNEVERVAHRCAEILCEEYGLKSSNFIPEDSVSLLFKIDTETESEALASIEVDFGIEVDWSIFHNRMDIVFRELVEEIVPFVEKK